MISALLPSSYGYAYSQYDPAMAEQPTLLHTAWHTPAGDEALLQEAAYSFPSQPSLLAAVGRPPLIAWPLCPACEPLAGVGWLCLAGSASEKAGWAAGRPHPVRVP